MKARNIPVIHVTIKHWRGGHLTKLIIEMKSLSVKNVIYRLHIQSLTKHQQLLHVGMKYLCDSCDY
jgi:hypothetical protein